MVFMRRKKYCCTCFFSGTPLFDAHLVEGAIDEVEGDEEEDDADIGGGLLERGADGNLHGENTEESGELDYKRANRYSNQVLSWRCPKHHRRWP